MPAPDDQTARLEALAHYGILDTEPEDDFDRIAQLTAKLCDTPVALINFLDENRQWFKAEVGLGLKQTSLDVSFCAHALTHRGVFMVPDTLSDSRFASNPLVVGWPHFRFYAGTPIETEEGTAVGTLCVLGHQPRGLSDAQKEAMQTLARCVMTLLELRRTRALLAEAAEIEAAAKRSQEKFISTLTLELRKPIAPMLNATSSLLRDENLSAAQRNELDKIRANAERGDKMIDDLAAWRQALRGDLAVKRAALDLHELFERVLESAQARGVNVPLQALLRAPEAAVVGDAARLEQALRAALNYSLRTTPADGCIALLTTNPRPGVIRVRIADTGRGIAPEDLPNLFAPPSSGPIDFSGADLFLSQEILELHHGTITASSKGENRGSNFIIELPLANAAPVASETSGDEATSTADHLRILVVEGDQNNVQMIARLLRRAGHDVETAETAERARVLFGESRYDLLITGLGLPDGNGAELMRYARERGAIEGIALREPNGAGAADASALEGFRESVVKPVEWPELEAALQRVAPGSPAA